MQCSVTSEETGELLVRQSRRCMGSERWTESLCADASLDLQLSLPGVDHLQAASQLPLQFGEVV